MAIVDFGKRGGVPGISKHTRLYEYGGQVRSEKCTAWSWVKFHILSRVAPWFFGRYNFLHVIQIAAIPARKNVNA